MLSYESQIRSLGVPESAVRAMKKLARKRACGFDEVLLEAVAAGLERMSAARPLAPPRVTELSPRQQRVWDLLREGWSVKEIANRMDVQESTVRTHIQRLKEHTGCTDLLGLRMGLRRGRSGS